jgi:hypothetical protein
VGERPTVELMGGTSMVALGAARRPQYCSGLDRAWNGSKGGSGCLDTLLGPEGSGLSTDEFRGTHLRFRHHGPPSGGPSAGGTDPATNGPASSDVGYASHSGRLPPVP